MNKLRRDRTGRRFLACLSVAVLLGLVAAPGGLLKAERLHLRLEASSPAADETVSSVDEIRLEFSQAPQMTGTRIRVLSGGEPLDLGDAAASADDDTIVTLRVTAGLKSGGYEVRWRAMSQDGHPVTGDYAFTVAAESR